MTIGISNKVVFSITDMEDDIEVATATPVSCAFCGITIGYELNTEHNHITRAKGLEWIAALVKAFPVVSHDTAGKVCVKAPYEMPRAMPLLVESMRTTRKYVYLMERRNNV